MTNVKKLIIIFFAVTSIAVLISLFQEPIDQSDIGLTQGGWIFLAVAYSVIASPVLWTAFILLADNKVSTSKVIVTSGLYSAVVLLTFFSLPESYGVFGLLFAMAVYAVVFSLVTRFLFGHSD